MVAVLIGGNSGRHTRTRLLTRGGRPERERGRPASAEAGPPVEACVCGRGGLGSTNAGSGTVRGGRRRRFFGAWLAGGEAAAAGGEARAAEK